MAESYESGCSRAYLLEAADLVKLSVGYHRCARVSAGVKARLFAAELKAFRISVELISWFLSETHFLGTGAFGRLKF